MTDGPERPAGEAKRSPDEPEQTADEPLKVVPGQAEIDEAALLAEYESERPARKLSGWPDLVVKLSAAALSLLALYWVFNPITRQLYLALFLLGVLSLTFLAFRGWGRTQVVRDSGRADNPNLIDWLLSGTAILATGYVVLDWNGFFRRSVIPTELDLIVGTVLLLLVLEATRRTVGWVVPAICVGFLAYGYLGPLFPEPFDSASYSWQRIVGHDVMTSAGVWGVPLRVAATYVILFTLYGAVLEFSGASRFFLDVSFAAFKRSSAGPGRTVTLAGFLLGTVSGSGVATTVTLGGVSWPILRRAGYPPEQGGGVLAAAGIGAILSPPTLGAAAFIIAETLRVSYLEVLLWATVPTMLYYLGIILAVEMDARRFRTRDVEVVTPPLRTLLLRYGYHFSSLVAIVVFLLMGMSAFRAVVLATGLAFLLSFLDRRNWMTPRRIFDALAAGAISVLPAACVMAAAGIIVGILTLTGVALKLAGIIVALAGGELVLVAVYAALAIVLLGLAVPITASFIIAWVVIGPAFTELGVPAYAAAMFVFYYAVLSEVSPPTALAPFAASAITGGKPISTMWQTWRYTLPAFLVPFVFVLAPAGEGILLSRADPASILIALPISALAVGALAVVTGGWLLGPANWLERGIFAVGAVALLMLAPVPVAVGLGACAVGLAARLLRRRREGPQRAPA
ncbi:MAG TPA: TRAP transporter fused permease subunit [Candidatus Limnocylindria bacterium]|nr:TRAP transporter fused permease subunit [Candidatus Limnocylindria bacterium]